MPRPDRGGGGVIYKLTEATPSGEAWSNAHGRFQTYRIKLDGVEKHAFLNQKVETAPPAVGTDIDLELAPHDRFDDALKAKRVYANPTGGGGGRPRDPAERRSIQMQHAQKAAVDALRLACEKGDYIPPNAADVADHVKRIAQALYEQVEQAAGA